MIARNIVTSLAIILMSVLFLGVITGVNEKGTRTYNGSQTFGTLLEAIAFQSDLGNEATNSQAIINSIELTKQSPPTVTWSVEMPATKYNIFGDESLPFKYGKPWSSHTFSRNWNIFGFIFVPSVVTLFLYAVWSGWFDRQLAKGE